MSALVELLAVSRRLGVDVCVRGVGVGDAHLRLSVDLQCLGGKL